MSGETLGYQLLYCGTWSLYSDQFKTLGLMALVIWYYTVPFAYGPEHNYHEALIPFWSRTLQVLGFEKEVTV